ncbi:MAG: alpha/beta fold hydrolase [Henriciella sp.]|nr:alpha/beta fold hydrolase [Henriciella sp.]
MTVRKAYIDGTHGQIHFRVAEAKTDAGKPPLICLHQSPKCGLEFETFMQVASRDRRVIAPDYPGYGMSDAAPSEAETTIPMYAREMWRMADAIGLETVDLFGNHTGAKVAAEMATQQGDRVHAIAMISAAILTDEEREMFKDMFTPIPLDKENTRFRVSWERIIERQGPGQTLEMMDRSMYMNMMGGEAYEWGHVAAFAWGKPFDDALTRLPHRITLLNPTDDLTECTRRAAPLLRNGEVIECPQWGYGFMDAFPEDVADLVLEKLDAS